MLDPIEHPIISLVIITFIVLLVFFGIANICYYLGNYDDPYNYRYIDIDGNEGYAQWCNHNKNLNCYTNKGYIQVKEFHKND